MKKTLLFVFLLFTAVAFAQDYKKEWDRVIESEAEGLIKSAYAATDSIYLKAKKDKNESQLLKAFFFRSKYMQTLEEDSQLKIISSLEQEILISTPVTRSIMQSLYADMLSSVYKHNEYAIRYRKETETHDAVNFLTWTQKDFDEKIEEAYIKSLENRELLYNTPLEKYDAIIEVNPLIKTKNRSVYDFLAERYLFSRPDYTSYQDRTILEKQANVLFGTINEFSKFTISDSLKSDLKKKILLFHDLETFYRQKKDTTSLYRSALRRLEYFDSHLYLDNCKLIYLKTLSIFSREWSGHPYAYNAKLLQAGALEELANKKENHDYLIKAVALCNEIIANSRLTDAAPQATSLKNGIVNQRVKLMTEGQVIPEKPILAQVQFKNVDSLKVRIYRIKANNNMTPPDEFEEYAKTHIPLLEKKYQLPQKKNYFEYTTEIVLPALPTGYYLVAASPANKEIEESGFLTLQATQIALVSLEHHNTTIYQILDRETGKPLPTAKAIVYDKIKSLDKNAKLSLSLTKKQEKQISENITFLYEGDTLNTKWNQRYYGYNDDEEELFRANTQIYTDRVIYRPGQTVFFKGIITQYKKEKYSVVPDIYVSVSIEDASGKTIKEYRLKTNEFGSFSDKFTIPLNVMTGNFSINIDEDDDLEEDENYNIRKDEHPFWNNVDFQYAYLNFSVEEYKRPTFEAVFNPVKEDIVLHKKAQISGTAKSFNGALITGAKVKYRITRQAFSTRNFSYNRGENKEIELGETKTDSNGNFTIIFNAVPNEEFKAEELPVFTYTINAEITDINGEIREAIGSVRGAYHTLELDLAVPSVVNVNEALPITIDSKNLNGQFTPAKGEINIFKIKESNSSKVHRSWDDPELQTISKEEFERIFPEIAYHKSNDTVVYGKNVFYKQVNTENEKQIDLKDFSSWESGRYEIIYTAKDNNENKIKQKAIFTLKRDNDIFLANHAIYDYRFLNKKTYLEDRFIEIELFSSLSTLYINAVLDKGNTFYDNTVTLKNGRGTLKLPINKKIKTNVYIGFDCIWQNNFFSKSFEVTLTAEDNPYEFITETINNKLVPGNKETWSFTLKGNKMPAEVLASMYDKSLDQFKKDSWYFDVPNGSYNYNDVERHMDKDYNNKILMFDNNFFRPVSLNIYEYRLNTFGFDINGSKNIYTLQKLKMLNNKYQYQVSGIVTDASGMPIPGANVMIEGSDIGVQTDFDGMYTIAAAKGDKLVFAFVGMQTQIVTVKDNNNINAIMTDDAMMLEDVVVEAYRATTTHTLTSGNVVIIENNDDPSYLVRVLQGQVPGLQISAGSGQPGANSTVILRGYGSVNGNIQPLYVIDGVPLNEENFKSINPDDITNLTVLKDAGATSIYGNRGANGVIIITTKSGAKEIEALQQIKARKNFDETAFFYPQILTDENGKLSFSFTTPEALTEWKLRLLAHTKNAASGYYEKSFFTQKDVMVVPNMPRFLREKDTITLVAKVTNLTDEVKTGNALLQLFDAVTMESSDAQMLNLQNLKPFTIPAKGSTTVSWKITVPKGMQGVQYKVLAKAGDFTDGEENILPVLTSTVQVTESIPLWVRPNSTKEYSFKDFDKSFKPGITQTGITLEYTSNPVWLALQSLPYLMEFEHECSEQVFSRYYANSIASHVLNSNPKIAEVFAAWRKADKPLSKFEQNEELKSIVLSETPWILENQSSEEIKNRLALLFDLDKMEASFEASFVKLQNKQMASGGFPWFEGGKESSYITRHIAAGFGHLTKMGITLSDTKSVDAMTKKAVQFMDNEFAVDHKRRLSYLKKGTQYGYELPYDGMHYLYARSFYIDQYPMTDSIKKIADSYISAMNKSNAFFKMKWLDYSLYEKGMAALIMNRYGYKDTAKKILNNLKETSSNNEEWGMYWIENKAGYRWYQALVETQALLIEAFTEIDNDVASADAMKIWLIKNKQNKNWPTTKATAEAVYALMMKGTDWLSVKDNTTFKLGSQKGIDSKIAENEKEAGTGYIKLQWKPEEIKPDMGTLTVENKSAVPGYGGFYWQRSYENIEDYTPQSEGPLTMTKELYAKVNTAEGITLKSITAETPLKIGDLVTVRLVITAKEDMEYLHLKDNRASAFEPVDLISERKYNATASYYQSTRDAATHFFFDSLNKGVYVIEYDVRVNNAGNFTNGIATIQSMYAPEFTANSKGKRVHIE